MSNTKSPVSGPASVALRAPSADPETTHGGKGRWSAKRKMSVVLELLRGADLESTTRKYGVTAATLSEWRDAFLAAGKEGLKIRQEDLVYERGRRSNSVIAELAMGSDLLQRAHPAHGVREAFSAVEVETMSCARSASTGRNHDRTGVLKVQGLP